VYLMPISTARFLLRQARKAGLGRVGGATCVPGRRRPHPATRVTVLHCVQCTARAPGAAVMVVLHCPHRTVAAGPLDPPQFMAGSLGALASQA
jgi:hypothetical protein